MAKRVRNRRHTAYPIEKERLHVSGLAGLSGERAPRKRSVCSADSGRYTWQRINVCVDYRYHKGNVPQITSSLAAAEFIRRTLPIETAGVEHFGVIALDTGNVPLGVFDAHKGGISQSIVDVAAVFQPALALLASGVILYHNHPSGNSRPSSADDAITQRCVEAGKILGVRVLDHVVLGRGDTFSYLDSGKMP